MENWALSLKGTMFPEISGESREVEETPQLDIPLINVTANFTVLLEAVINLGRLMIHAC